MHGSPHRRIVRGFQRRGDGVYRMLRIALEACGQLLEKGAILVEGQERIEFFIIEQGGLLFVRVLPGRLVSPVALIRRILAAT